MVGQQQAGLELDRLGHRCRNTIHGEQYPSNFGTGITAGQPDRVPGLRGAGRVPAIEDIDNIAKGWHNTSGYCPLRCLPLFNRDSNVCLNLSVSLVLMMAGIHGSIQRSIQGLLQGSLLDALDDPTFATLPGSIHRIALTEGAWIDVLPQWLTGADQLFDALRDTVAWRAERRQMYQRIVAVPRLTAFYDDAAPLPHPLLRQAKTVLNARYLPELGEPLRTAGLCLYRDGRDSVAWHSDDLGRGKTEDTIVAILSLGSPRALLLRPKTNRRESDRPKTDRRESRGPESGGAATIRHNLGHGDLLVMGGSCQRTWEHAVPKTARSVGPRISVQFRPQGVR